MSYVQQCEIIFEKFIEVVKLYGISLKSEYQVEDDNTFNREMKLFCSTFLDKRQLKKLEPLPEEIDAIYFEKRNDINFTNLLDLAKINCWYYIILKLVQTISLQKFDNFYKNKNIKLGEDLKDRFSN